MVARASGVYPASPQSPRVSACVSGAVCGSERPLPSQVVPDTVATDRDGGKYQKHVIGTNCGDMLLAQDRVLGETVRITILISLRRKYCGFLTILTALLVLAALVQREPG